MKKLRTRFLWLAIGLLIPIGLLVQRALESVRFEREARHEAIAERLFDEVERELSGLLAREEAREFGEYTFYYSPDGRATAIRQRSLSPLAGLPEDDFIVGYFQINPDGSFQTPHRPLDTALARRNGDWTPDPERNARLERLDRLAAAQWKQEKDADDFARKDRLRKDSEAQRAGTTLELKQGRLQESEAPGKSKSRDFSAYDALQSLNRGAQLRAKREVVVQEEAVAPASEPELDAAESDALEGLASSARANLPSSAPATAPARSPPAESPALADAPEPLRKLRVQLAPMTSRALDAEHLLLYRTVARGSRAYRQGLLIETAKLAQWLDRGALESTELGGWATLSFWNPFASDEPHPRAEFVYRHRFAEPFADIGATLSLIALPGVGGGMYVVMLSALLVGAAVVGLLALYRMVAVVVRFAERRSNFAAAVSHELKTPLTAIRMYAEMLRDGMVTSDGQRTEYYEALTNESERLSRLINNVLEFSQLERGTRQLALEAGPIAPVVEETRQLLRTHVEREGFTLDLHIDPDLPLVRFDRDALLQVLFNLVDNALKYAADAGTKQIRLHCERDGDGVCLSVRDFGPGVAPAELRQVFEPFYRGGEELTRRTKGTGIGLALVRSLVESMDAKVSAERADPGMRVRIDFAGA